MIEIWKDIPNYEGLYQVSNLGNVKSLRFGKERILKQQQNGHGYLKVCLYKNSENKQKTIHSLVAQAFLNHKPNKYEMVVNHINFIKDDNRLENLEIVTNRENSNQKHIKSSSVYTGVAWNKARCKWYSQIVIDNKYKYLGVFDTEIEASQYYENALKSIELGLPIEVKRHITSSKYKCVHFNKEKNKWCAHINVNGNKKHLGCYQTELEAYGAYQNAIKQTHLL